MVEFLWKKIDFFVTSFYLGAFSINNESLIVENYVEKVEKVII